MRFLIDTGFFFALASKKDPDHERVRAAWEGLRGERLAQLCLTTNHIVSEAITLTRYGMSRAVLGAGVILTGSVTVYHLVKKTSDRREGSEPLRIPAGAVVVPGARKLLDSFAEKHGLSLYTPVIVKYRDEKTDAAVALEDALR